MIIISFSFENFVPWLVKNVSIGSDNSVAPIKIEIFFFQSPSAKANAFISNR